MKHYILIFTLMLFSAFSTYASQSEGITVVGKATIEKEPDRFSVAFTIEQRGKVVSKLKTNIDNNTKLLINAIKQMKVADHDITNTNMQIYPIYPQRNNRVNRAYIEGGANDSAVFSVTPDKHKQSISAVEFQVKRVVQVNLSHVDKYERLLDRALKIGVSRISPVQTSFSNAEKLYQQALQEALSNAQFKADQLATNLGVKLGIVKRISEQAYRAPGPVLMAAEMSDAGYSRKNYTGLNQVSAEVTVTFAIEQ